MTKLSQQVAEFHDAFSQINRYTPTIPDDDAIRLRLRLVLEEAFELAESCAGAEYHHEFLRDSMKVTLTCIANMPIKVDFPEFVDALGDLQYVICGTYLTVGVDDEPVTDTIHAANMAKRGGPIDEHGKQKKPPGWTPPDIRGELVKQGWEP